MKKRKGKVIVLDVDSREQDEIKRLFETTEVSLCFYDNLSDVIKAVKETKFNCAIVSMRMQRISRNQTVSILKALDADLPIILTAEDNTPEIEIKVYQQDIFYYFIKPFGGEELKCAVFEGIKKSKEIENIKTIN